MFGPNTNLVPKTFDITKKEIKHYVLVSVRVYVTHSGIFLLEVVVAIMMMMVRRRERSRM